MQFLDAAVVKLGIPQVAVLRQPHKEAAGTLLKPGFVLPLEHLSLQSPGFPRAGSAKLSGYRVNARERAAGKGVRWQGSFDSSPLTCFIHTSLVRRHCCSLATWSLSGK